MQRPLSIVTLICLLVTLPMEAVRGGLVISELDLANNIVELVNTGESNVDISDWWWCNRVNGSPAYLTVDSSSTIDVELSTATSLSEIGAGEILVLEINETFLPDDNGELGLYNANTFSSPAAIEDYVVWGGVGVRDSVAERAGIWVDNEAVDVTDLGANGSIQLSLDLPGDAAGDYFLGDLSLGVAQSLPVASLGCDVNQDGVCDASDIDAMTQLVLDGVMTPADRIALIESASPDGFQTFIGDSDLNGQFDEQDIVAAFVDGKYLTGESAGWSAGDWDGNLVFDEQDLVSASVAGGYLQPPRVAVPEPSSGWLLLLGLSLLGFRRNI